MMVPWNEWTPEEKGALIRLAIDQAGAPISAADIARAVGAPSRNAVIGVCNRQGIRLPITPNRPHSRPTDTIPRSQAAGNTGRADTPGIPAINREIPQ